MKQYLNSRYSGERALYNIHDAEIDGCTFFDGESPLKECSDLTIKNTSFEWKYPIWYSQNVKVYDSAFLPMSRSGIWYTSKIEINNCKVDAPKLFRRCDGVTLVNSKFSDASETLWMSKHIYIKNCYFNGDYLGMNSSDIFVENMVLDGNYLFDGGKNIIVKNSILNSKDAFWNTENVLIENCKLIGEYLAWNTKNITFKNCYIESNQGLCYIDELTLENCTTSATDLAFERCSNINAEIKSPIVSIKNPYSGKIVVDDVNEIILDDNIVDRNKTIIEVKKHES